MPEIFISYSRKDQELVEHLVQALQKQGRELWVDLEKIRPSAEWLAEIYAGIEDADNFVFVISEHSLKSQPCGWEVAHAAANNKRLVPIVRGEVDYEAFRQTMTDPGWEGVAWEHWETLRSLNWIFFRKDDDFAAGLRRLSEAIDTDLDYVRTHTDLQRNALDWNAKGRKASDTLRGDSLTQAEEWLVASQGQEPPPTDLQVEYTVASRTVSRKRLRLSLGAAGVALAVVSVLSGVALIQFRGRDEQEKIAQQEAGARVNADATANAEGTARAIAEAVAEEELARALSEELAASAQAALEIGDVIQGYQLAIQAYQTAATLQAERALYAAVYSPHPEFILEGHGLAVSTASFSPDGKLIVSGSYDATILWDAETGKQLAAFAPPDGTGKLAAFTSDSRRIISSGDNSTRCRSQGECDVVLHTWDVAKLALDEPETIEGLTGVIAASYIGQGYTIVAAVTDNLLCRADCDHTVRVWDVKSSTSIAVLDHLDDVSIVRFSPDGSRLLTVVKSLTSDNEEARIWSTHGGDLLLTFEKEASINDAAFSPNGSRIATSGFDRTVRIWDAESGQELNVLEFEASGTPLAVNFDPDGNRIVTGDTEGIVRVWEAAGGAQLAVLRGHSDSVQLVSFSPDGQRIVSADYDNVVWVWNARPVQSLGSIEGSRLATISPDGTRVLTGGQGGIAVIWDVESGAALMSLEGHTELVESARFGPAGERVVTGSADGTAHVWNAMSGEEIFVLDGHLEGVDSVDFSPDGVQIVTVSGFGIVRLWDALSGNELESLWHSGPIDYARFSPDGSYIVTVSRPGTVWVWDAEASEQVATIQAHEGATSASFSPGETRIVTTGMDEYAYVWDWAIPEKLVTLRGHTESVSSGVFSPDGSRVATGGWDGTLRIWDAATGMQLASLDHTPPSERYSALVLSVEYSPDGSYIVTSSTSSTATHVWGVSVDELLRLATARLARLGINVELP